MKTFSNYSDLIKKTSNQSIYIELSNGYYLPTDKDRLKLIADSMAKNDEKFCGDILEYSKDMVKVSLAK